MSSLSKVPIHSKVTFNFPWEELYLAAVLETDNSQLKQRISVAVTALLKRFGELSSEREDEAELRAVEDALGGMSKLKRERLHDS
jgi:hypothetical protein